MAQTLLINPRKRGRKARRKNPSAAQKRNWARFAAMARSRAGSARKSNPKRRRRNPANYASGYAPVMYATNPRRRRSYRRNPVRAIVRRRRNPISLGGTTLNMNSVVSMFKEAAIMGGGAVLMDWGYSKISQYLPASMQAGPGQISAGTVVKMGITAALGIVLNRATKGLSRKAAMGAMVVQARDVALAYAPASIAGSVAGLGYLTPVPAWQRNLRTNTNGVGAYLPGMRSPALNGYVPGMKSPTLNGARLMAASRREGWR